MVYMIEQRLTGTFKMPNDLGAYLALSLPFVMGYFAAGFRNSFQRLRFRRICSTLILGTILVLMSANLVLTLTRAAWVSVAVAAIFIGFYLVISMLSTTISWEALFISTIFSERCVLRTISEHKHRQAIIDTVPRHIKGRFQTMLTHPEGFMSERPQWWRTSLEFIGQHPLTGIGPGRFRYEYQLNGPPEQYDTPYHAHNIYLHIAAEHGIPSLLLFLWMVAIICRSVFAMRQTEDFWGMGTFIGASGFLISALIYGLADNIPTSTYSVAFLVYYRYNFLCTTLKGRI